MTINSVFLVLELWHVLIISFIFFICIFILADLFGKLKYKKTINEISNKIKELTNTEDISLYNRNDIYHIHFKVNDLTFYLKLVFSTYDHEFIITNTNKWTVTDNPKQWTRKSKPLFIEDSDSFINLRKDDKDVRKIVLIYPTSKRVIRYLNESDTVIVNPKENHLGIHFVSYINLEEVL